MSGYYVKNSIDSINEYCNNPSEYKSNLFQGVINDALVHYEQGNASKEWYENVVRTLTPYLN